MKIQKDDIYKIVSSILDVEINKVKKFNHDNSFEDYGIDSILSIRLIIMLEEKYSFEFKDNDLLFDKYNTFNKLFDLLESY